MCIRISVTGASGFIGSALIPELIHGGRQVLGLTRSEEGARTLVEAGAEAWREDVNDVNGLRRPLSRVEA